MNSEQRDGSRCSVAPSARRRTRILPTLVISAYPAWLAMMAVHEFGHVLHAWLAGGRVLHVRVPLWGFSYTELESNPHPLFVAWGGCLWGCAIPLFSTTAATLLRGPAMIRRVLHAFAGFCLVANGAYLAVGQADAVGDAGDLLRYGVPRSVLVLVGGVGVFAGLLLWHRLSRRPDMKNTATND